MSENSHYAKQWSPPVDGTLFICFWVQSINSLELLEAALRSNWGRVNDSSKIRFMKWSNRRQSELSLLWKVRFRLTTEGSEQVVRQPEVCIVVKGLVWCLGKRAGRRDRCVWKPTTLIITTRMDSGPEVTLNLAYCCLWEICSKFLFSFFLSSESHFLQFQITAGAR